MDGHWAIRRTKEGTHNTHQTFPAAINEKKMEYGIAEMK